MLLNELHLKDDEIGGYESRKLQRLYQEKDETTEDGKVGDDDLRRASLNESNLSPPVEAAAFWGEDNPEEELLIDSSTCNNSNII